MPKKPSTKELESRLLDETFRVESIIGSEDQSRVLKKLVCVLMLAALFMGIEVAGGIISHSIAILSDAAHMLSDLLGFVISILSVYISGLPANRQHSYGFHRAGIIGALASVLVIWVLTGFLLYYAVERVLNLDEVEVEGPIMFGVACFGLLTNLVMIKVLHGDGHGHSHGHDHGHGHSHGHDHGHGHSHGKRVKDAHDHKHGAHEHEHKHKSKKETHNHEHKHEHEHDHEEHEHDHKHEDKHEHGHNHDHSHEHDHKHDHSHEHEHKHEGHEHKHDHSHEHEHEHKHDHSHEHKHDHIHDHSHDHREPAAKDSSIALQIHNDESHEHEHSDSHSHSHVEKKKVSKPHDHENMNVRATIIHIFGDILQSIGVIIASGLIWINPDWKIADPIVTFIFAIIVLYTTLRIIKDCIFVLMEGTPADVDLEEFENKIKKVQGVVEVHDLHVWALGVGKPAMSAHVYTDSDAAVVLKKVTKISNSYGIFHSTIQVETTQDKSHANYIECKNNIH